MVSFGVFLNRRFKINHSLLAVTLVFGILVSSASFASKNGNGEYWQNFGLEHELNKDWKIAVIEQVRFGRAGGDPYLHSTDIGFIRGLDEWIDIGFNFKKEYAKDSSGKFRQENRPHFNIMLKSNLFGLGVGDRIRLEYRDFERQEDVWRFRNKTTVNLPLKFTPLNLQPYLADEFFINLGEGQGVINQNRVSAGFSFNVAENIKAEIYYMLKSDKTTDGWLQTNVVGTQFIFSF